MKELEEISMREKFGEKILDLSILHDNVYVLDGDLANSTKSNLVQDKNEEKFLQMGIAEQNMVGVSAGLATAGIQPWVSTFAAFLSKRSLDQVQVSVSQNKLDVKLIGAYAGLLNGKAGKTHQALEDVAIMRSLSNMVVIAPADTLELDSVINFAYEYNGPVYIRLARDKVQKVFDDEKAVNFKLGKAVKLRNGEDVTVISSGTQTARALNVANSLNKMGISISVLHIPSIKPIDKESIIEEAKKTGAIVTTEDHSIYGGLGSAVAEVIVQNHPVPMLINGVNDVNSQSGPNEELLDFYGIDEYHISELVKKVVYMKSKMN